MGSECVTWVEKKVTWNMEGITNDTLWQFVTSKIHTNYFVLAYGLTIPSR